MSNELGLKLLEIRKRSGLGSQRAAAAVLETTANTVWNYEKGKTLPDIDYLANFARHTGADLDELLALRLVAGGHERPTLTVRESPLEYQVPPNLAALRSRLMISVMPQEWALYLTELVLRGKISEAAAGEIADFFDTWQPDKRWLESFE